MQNAKQLLMALFMSRGQGLLLYLGVRYCSSSHGCMHMKYEVAVGSRTVCTMTYCTRRRYDIANCTPWSLDALMCKYCTYEQYDIDVLCIWLDANSVHLGQLLQIWYATNLDYRRQAKAELVECRASLSSTLITTSLLLHCVSRVHRQLESTITSMMSSSSSICARGKHNAQTFILSCLWTVFGSHKKSTARSPIDHQLR